MASTNTREEILKRFTKAANNVLQHYPNLSGSEVELLNYSENATYLVKKPEGEKYVIRVCRPGYHSFEEIETELFFIDSIYKNTKVEVSRPLPGADGEFIYGVSDENGNEYYCILFEYLPGSIPDVDNEEKLIKIFEKIGEISALVHEHVIANWDTFHQKKRLTWDYETILGENPKWGRWQDSIDLTPERIKLFQEVSDMIKVRLDTYGKDRTKFGLVHCDLRHANLLVDGDDVRVIDFDDSGFSYYLYDLASTLTFIEHRPYVPKLIESWLKGYRKIRHLSVEEENEIPTFIMLRRLQILAWLGSRDNETSDEIGGDYTEQTEILAKKFLEHFKN